MPPIYNSRPLLERKELAVIATVFGALTFGVPPLMDHFQHSSPPSSAAIQPRQTDHDSFETLRHREPFEYISPIAVVTAHPE